MTAIASPSDGHGRRVSYMELVFHVKKLVDEGRLTQVEGCATLDALRSALGSPDDCRVPPPPEGFVVRP